MGLCKDIKDVKEINNINKDNDSIDNKIFLKNFQTNETIPNIGLSVLYADDDTEHSQDKDPDQLVAKIQFEADCATTWVADNKLVCLGGKTKLLIVTTTAMRLTRIVGRKLQISVCGAPVIESECEKILGVIANNKLTWFHQLYGDKSDLNKPQPGLIPQLAKHVGLLSRLVHLVPLNRFKKLVDGMFMSKLRYCVQLFGNVSSIGTMEEGETHKHAFTKANLHNLQILQNKAMRLIAKCGYKTPVVELLRKTDFLSVNQIIAHTSLVTIFCVKYPENLCTLQIDWASRNLSTKISVEDDDKTSTVSILGSIEVERVYFIMDRNCGIYLIFI